MKIFVSLSTQEEIRQEGFWYNGEHDPYAKDFPMPVANGLPFEGQSEWLQKLRAVEAQAKVHGFRGHSHCRLCDKYPNGSQEYEYRGWRWPSGYMHYVEDHNVRPSPAFKALIAIAQ